jgi:hypothetical protein
MQAVEVTYAEPAGVEARTRLGIFDQLERRKVLVVALTVALAFCARVYRLDAAGLAEDETNKLFAVRSYQQGDFTANADHPMLMKMLCFVSVQAGALWNRTLGTGGLSISDETALRLPNVTFGALTVIPLFLLTTALLGFRVGLLTSLLWAIGVNAVWINRVVKEDTLLVFFMLTAFYLYNCAKERPASDISGQERLYALAGAAFGLMMASKYFPHYFGLAILFYHLAGFDSRNNRPRPRSTTRKMFAAMILAFVAFNPALFVPQTWRYLSKYLSENLLTHHGYLFMDTLYNNDPSSTPNGSPWYFYFLFLAIKVPLPVLIAFLVGLVEVFRRRTRGYLFLRLMLVFWLVPQAVAGAKFLRYTLSLMPLVYMTAAVGVILISDWLIKALKVLTVDHRRAQLAAAFVCALLFVLTPAVLMARSLPYPSLYLNLFGGARVGYFFPHDEFYDLGARESIKYIADTAPAGAIVASEIPGVMQFYLERYGRTDIRSEILSHPDFALSDHTPAYVLLQRGRMYFENEETFKAIERGYHPLQGSSYEGADASRVYLVNAAQSSMMK